ncbi:uncharacterized protein DUF559 [Homoserinimonas aerilata]|uniref:Uncharacterized protein DUF559 n=1 Tax=Homoserinimonas aerilata TaxID=1162970 RepID=A0A542YGL7_9MICO|nr:uncharacterized protein DUF559 [Homoserinimonas aerilata]
MRPFHGVHVDGEASEPRHRINAYRRRMLEAQHFSHTTAATIHGMPLPLAHDNAPALHVSADPGAGFPRAGGVIGHHASDLATVVTVDGIPVTSAVDTWCELSTILDVDDLIAIGDFLITGDEPYSGIPPLVTVGELEAAVLARAGRRGIRRLIEAFEQVCYGAMSRMETLTRLLLERGGLPRPALNHRIFGPHGALIAMVDLAYVEQKIAVEYQGEHHREKERFRLDITRRERIEDEGWTVVFVSADDILRAQHETLVRIRSRLRSRGAQL